MILAVLLIFLHPRMFLVSSALLVVLSLGAAEQNPQSSSFRTIPLTVPVQGKVGFSRVGPESGLNFTNVVSRERYTTNQIYLNGGGVAAGDIDGDGLSDLLFANLGGPNALFRNLGNWKFEEIASRAGIALPNLDTTGVALADLDGDGDLDAVMNTVGQGTHIFFNDGKGKFSPGGTYNPGKGGMSLAIADIDGDGDLDVYVTNYRTSTIRDDPHAKISGEYVNGRPVPSRYNGRPMSDPDLQGRFVFGPTGKIIENGELDLLLVNEGTGKFRAIGFTERFFLEEDGKPLQSYPYDWGLSCLLRDFNGDGAPDLYVCNDFDSPDRFWINDGKGRFRAVSWQALRHTSMFSMGVDVADLNRDGFDDFFVVDMLSRTHENRAVQTGEVPPYVHKPGETETRPSYSYNTLFLNRGDGSYAEMAWYAGLQASEWSWAPVFIDVDLDGFEDVLVTTGHELEMMNGDVIDAADRAKNARQMSRMELLSLKHMFGRLNAPNVAFRNRGDLTFEDVSSSWGFDEQAVSHGIALVDLDNDGDLDVAINNLNTAATVLRNETSAPRVAVRLKGVGKNTHGIGAKIKLLDAAVPQSQEMISAGRYLSSDDPIRVFAANSVGKPMTLEVTWRSGKRSIVSAVQPNHLYEVTEVGALPPLSKPPPAPLPLFAEVKLQPEHTHVEEFFDDFQRQFLLPFRLSQPGPGVAWHDVDGDGWEDLLVSGGRGGRLAVFRNAEGVLTSLDEPVFQRPLARDQTSILGLGSILLAGSSNYEDGMTNGGWTRVYDLVRKAAGENVLGPEAATGPLALGDIDKDGNLDLFIAGRAIGGRYPFPATSLLLKYEGGRFVPQQRLEQLGLVNGAVFSDLDDDGDLDLVLACHWDSIKILRNDNGRFSDASEQFGLSPLKGLWNGIAVADFNNDGLLDFVASNWGLNTPFKATPEHPLNVYYGDFDGNGIMDLVEARYDLDLKKEVPLRGYRLLSMGLPQLKERFPTRASFARLSVADLLGTEQPRVARVSATELRHMLFLNRGGKFQAIPLPFPAQLSPAFGIVATDFNGDGNEDLFLAQNFFATNLETPRTDAGLGLLLEGDGKGAFHPLSHQESGLRIYGEQRGSASADFDRDGRVDLVVTQNAGPTKVFRNLRSDPGVRIRLQGPAGNRDAIGAKLRLKKGGPTKEIHAGSGYLGGNSPVLLFPAATSNAEFLVRWPDNTTSTISIPAEAREVRVDSRGKVEQIR